ncbi:MAG: hypothetical protein R3C28_07050 [Pirellulaceae bacterium]
MRTSLPSTAGGSVGESKRTNWSWSAARRGKSNYGHVVWRKPLAGHFCHGVAFSPTTPHQCAVGFETGVQIWDVAAGKQVFEIPVVEYIKQLDYSPDGQLLGVIGRSGVCNYIQPPMGSWFARSKTEQTSGMLTGQFSPDGTQIATGGGDFMLRFWDVATGELISEWNAPDWILRLGFSPDGKRVFTTSKDGTVTIWDSERGDALITLATHADAEVWSAEFSPNGNSLLAVGKQPYLWHVASPSTVRTAQGLVTDGLQCEPLRVVKQADGE